MAIYEYFCEKCNYRFQLNFPIGKAEEKTDCPSCKSLSRRIYSRFLIFSKGESPPEAPSRSPCNSCATRDCSSCNL